MHKTSNFPERLKELRTKKKLSHIELGEKIGVNGSSISHWENGNVSPSLENVEKLVEFFGVTLHYLTGWDE